MRESMKEHPMAFKGGAAPVKPGMKDQTSSNIARDGAAKRPQTSFATKEGMRSRIGSVPGVKGYGTGPDADPANPIAPMKEGKTFKDAPAAWGMRDANGQSVNHDLGRRVLGEGVLSAGPGKQPSGI
jgi:hypothetical protein